MVRIALFALAGAAVWYGWILLRNQQKRVAEALREAEAALAKKEPMVLVKDPETGIYRPAEPRD